MSTTANSSNLFDSYKQRFLNASHGGQGQYAKNWGNPADAAEFDSAKKDIQALSRNTAIDLEAAQSNAAVNSQASNARSAFAAGAASNAKKLFRRRGSGAYGAIGKLNAANQQEVTRTKKQLAELEALDPESETNTRKQDSQIQRSLAATQLANANLDNFNRLREMTEGQRFVVYH